jgi:hypothetical protein
MEPWFPILSRLALGYPEATVRVVGARVALKFLLAWGRRARCPRLPHQG